MKKSGILFFTVVIIAIAGWFLQSKFDKTVEKITIAEGYGIGFALIFIAESQGYFADERLDVTFNSFTSGRDALNNVLSGHADIATTYVTPVAMNTISGKKLAVITELYRSTKNSAIVARRDRGIATAADLRGKRIAVTNNTTAEYFLSRFLDSKRMSISDVEIVATKPEEMSKKLKEGLVDAVATWNPHLYKTKHQFAKNETVTFQFDDYSEMSMLVGRAEVVWKRSEAFKKLLRALTNAEVFLQNHREKSIDITVSRLPDLSPTSIKDTWDLFDRGLGLSVLTMTVMEDQAQWFKDHGKFDGAIPNFRSIILSNYLRSAKPEAVAIRVMHVVDMFILFSIGQVVAWLVLLYVDSNGLRLFGHMFVTTLGAFLAGYLSLRFYSEADKFSMIFAAFLGAGILWYLVRFRVPR
jgi:NitT/TauT family transport system substrate-binding protein